VKRDRRPVLITDARPSPRDELRFREIRYAIMMAIRAVALVIAAVLVSAHAPLLWLWLPVCGIGMVVVPWLAVIWANDRLPKKRLRLRRREPPTGPRALPAEHPPRVIDADD
jgi:hypothetical protein